jgi:Protein of unknown function (DUF4230)
MGVVSPERERTRPPVEPPVLPPPPPPERRGNPWPFLTVLLVILALVGAFLWIRGALPDFDNPFAERTVDRTQEPVLQAVRDIGEYRAAAGEYQVVVDLEKDTKLPSELLGERTLFVAAGSVDAGIDLSMLGEDAVTVSGGGRAVTIELPTARLYEAELDLDRSYVYERDEGLLNEIGNLFSDDEGYEREAMLAAERKLDEAARSNDELLDRAEANTSAMLESLVRGLGFDRVDVRFASSG